MLARSARSLSVIPPAEWVIRVTSTLPYETRRSGWCQATSARWPMVVDHHQAGLPAVGLVAAADGSRLERPAGQVAREALGDLGVGVDALLIGHRAQIIGASAGESTMSDSRPVFAGEPAVDLGQGVAMPLVGLGVWQIRDGRAAEDAVGWALEAG